MLRIDLYASEEVFDPKENATSEENATLGVFDLSDVGRGINASELGVSPGALERDSMGWNLDACGENDRLNA